MGTHLLTYDLNPEFPFNIYDFTTYGDRDKIHWHGHYQIALCIEGRGKFIFNQKKYDVSKGDVFIVNNFENHVAVSEPPEHILFTFAIFLPELIAAPGSKVFDFEYLSPFLYDSKTFCNKIDGTKKEAKQIAQIMMEIKEFWKRKRVGYKHLVDANLKRILGILINYYKITDSSNSIARVHSHIKMQPALNYINQHFTENIKLKDVADLVHMSESRFRHLFKETANLGFKDYITYLRLNEAKKMLLTTDMNLTDIIYKVGFSNIYYFYKKFQKHFSMTPNEYRKYFRDNIIDNVLPKHLQYLGEAGVSATT